MLKFKILISNKLNLGCYISICAICSTLMACGTKGPLYIPEQRYPQGVQKPASQDSSAPTNKKAPPSSPTVKDY